MATIDINEAKRITAEKEQQYGLPEGTLFKIGGIESSFNKFAVSPKGAKGYFQFMPETAKAYGLTDPTDFEQSADAAGRYIKDNLAKYGGDMNLALADYNGGPKAVAAFKAGRPFAETLGYLKKFNGDTSPITTVNNGYSPQFNTAVADEQTVSPSAAEAEKATQANAFDNAGFINTLKNAPEAIGIGFRTGNSVYDGWQQKAIENVDPNFKWTKENLQGALEGVPERNWNYILEAKSDQEAMSRKSRILYDMQQERRMQEMGFTGFSGFAARMPGALIDVPTLISFVPLLGESAWATTGSRLLNLVRMGFITGATNLAYDAATLKNRPLGTTDDLYWSAATGFGIGGIIGGSLNPAKIAARQALKEELKDLSKFGRRSALEEEQDIIKSHGYELTDKGREYFDKAIKATQERNTQVLSKDDKLNQIFKFDGSREYVIRNGLLEEVKFSKKEPPVFDRGRINARDHGAENSFVGFMSRIGVQGMKTFDDLLKHFQFDSKGNITKVLDSIRGSAKLVKSDLEALGLDTKDALKRAFDQIKISDSLQKLARFAKVDTATNTLKKLMSHADPRIAKLAARLDEQLLSDVPVYTVRQKDIDQAVGRGYAGFYDQTRHAVFIPEGASAETILHELLHGATVHKIVYGLANPNTVHGQLVKELNDLYRQALAKAKSEGFKSYYLKNVKEFAAGLYTGKDAQKFLDFLKDMKSADGTKLLSKIVDVIRQLFGLGADETNALVHAMDLTDRLIDEPLTVKMDRGPYHGVDTLHFHSTTGDEATAEAASRADLPPVFGWGLGLEHKLGGSMVPQAVRNLAGKLFGSTVGYKGHAVVKANAWEDTLKWADSWAVDLRKGTYGHFDEWFKESNYKWHEKGKAFDDFGTQVSDYVRGIEGDFPPQVIKAGDHMRKVLGKVVDYINNPLFDEGMTKRGLTETEITDIKTGVTEMVGQLEKNPNYLPRKHDVNKWNSLVSQFGRDAVEGWWARAHQAGRGGQVSDEAAAKFGKWYVRTVEDAHANRTQDLVTDMLRGQDKEALRNSLMTHGGYSEAEARDVIENMFPTKPSDTGRTSSSLKHRNTIDEKYSETWTLPDGSKVDVGINNFVHSNAFDVVEPYLRRTAASVSLAKHLDVYKTTDIDRLIAEATQNKLGNEFRSNADVAKTRDDLKFAFDRVLGVPQEEFSRLRKTASMWHDFNIIRLMGGAVWNQAVELSQIVGTMGWKTTLKALPELRALKRDLASGKAPNDLLDQLENTIGGVGSEYIQRMDFSAKDDWVRNLGDTAFNRRLDALDTGMKKFARGVLDYTGMTPLMIQQKRVHAIALVNHFVNVANGKIKSPFLTKDRLAWMGLSEGDTARLMENLKKYTKDAKGEYSSTFKLDLDSWVKNDPQSHSQFMTAIHRESRRVVQENDLASMIPIMGTTLGKTVFQFMNFSMHGWNKSMNFALNHRDYSTFATMMHGSLLASLSYMGRTHVIASGMDEEKKREFLEKRLNPVQIVANSFGRLAQVSLLPNIYDTLSPYPMFSGMRTTSDLSSLASNPTYQAVNSLISMKKIIRNTTSDEYQTTSRDMKTWFKLLPLNNVFPMTTILNGLANDYPTTEKEE